MDSENYAFLIGEVAWLLFVSFRQIIPKQVLLILWSVSFLYMHFMFIHSFYLSLLILPKIYQFRPLDVCTLESTVMTLWCVVAASISTEAYCFLIWRGSKEKQ